MDETGIQNRITLPVDRKDVEAVVVFPDGKQMLWVRQPTWMRLWIFACSTFAIGLTVAAFGWGALTGAIGGIGFMWLILMSFPRKIFQDPGKPHHWPQ